MAGLAKLLEWNTTGVNSSDPSSWRPFVTCSAAASVDRIFLSGVSVGENSDRLFSYLCQLTSLRSLRLLGILPDEFLSGCTGMGGLAELA